MGKPQKKATVTDAKRSSAALSLELGLSKKPRTQSGPGAQLQAKKLVDSAGAPTIEGLKHQVDTMMQELLGKIDRNHAAVLAKVNEAEAAVHKQAKADHARTCQVLQDSQAAMDLAAQQHAAATKQVAHEARGAASAVDRVAKAAADNIREVAAKFERDLAALRSKAGLKA